MKPSEIRKLSDEQLVHAELKTERELVQATFQHRLGQFQNSARLAILRKDIARYRTVQRERELLAGLTADYLRNSYRKTFSMELPAATEEKVEKPSRGFLGSLVDRIKGTS